MASSYSTVEFDPLTGRRGRRHDLLGELLRYLTGAEATAVVNNCAAAVLLMLTALARGKEVIVARGELVEIGGGFRMPEVMRLSGARMVEVGTTNRTRAEDYAAAVTPKEYLANSVSKLAGVESARHEVKISRLNAITHGFLKA